MLSRTRMLGLSTSTCNHGATNTCMSASASIISSNSVFESAISVSLFSCAMCCLQCYQKQFEQYNKEILWSFQFSTYPLLYSIMLTVFPMLKNHISVWEDCFTWSSCFSWILLLILDLRRCNLECKVQSKNNIAVLGFDIVFNAMLNANINFEDF